MSASVGRDRDLYAFMERMQRATQEAKDLLLPELQILDVTRPWSVASLARLRQVSEELTSEAKEALAHVQTYEEPLLRFEERLEREDPSFAEYEARLRSYELAFWRERFADGLGAGGHERAPNPPEYVCTHHRVTAAEIRRTARELDCWDVSAIAGATGATTTCGSCRLKVTRILIDELRMAKAEARVR